MDASPLTTTADNLQRLAASATSAVRHCVVAFSGGVDSTLLLLAAHQYCKNAGVALSAVHVHHGLSPNADSWLSHCQAVCDSLAIPLEYQHVSLTPQPRKSLEALARDARYSVLLNYCRQHHGVLLLGQHSQDQLETVLLQLKRGAGPKGLAGMGESQYREGILLLRPMLMLEKADIEQAVRQQGVDWIEDESNDNDEFDRNFLRHHIIPALTRRWPQLPRTVARSAGLCAEQDAMLTEEAERRLAGMLGENHQLLLSALRKQSQAWQRAILRCWLDQQAVAMPGYSQLEQILQMSDAREDAQPVVVLGSDSVRRFDDALYVTRDTVGVPESLPAITPATDTALPWLHTQVKLELRDPDLARAAWTLQTGMPAVKIKPEGETVSKLLKHWLKQWKIPVWERSGVTLICCDEQPAALITQSQAIILQPYSGRISLQRNGH